MRPLAVELGSPWLWRFVLQLAVEVLLLRPLLLCRQLLQLLGRGQVFRHRGSRWAGCQEVVGGRLELPGGRSRLGRGQGWGGGRG